MTTCLNKDCCNYKDNICLYEYENCPARKTPIFYEEGSESIYTGRKQDEGKQSQ